MNITRVFCVSYDLSKPNRNYNSLYDELKKSKSWWHYLQSTWLIFTDESADTLAQRLLKHLDKDDSLLVIEVNKDRQGWLPNKAWEWIKDHIDGY